MRERIQIRPGVFILVTPKVKKNAGLTRSDRVKETLNPSENADAIREIARSQNKCVKYSRVLLDEAVALSRVIGEIKAAKKMEVGLWSLKGRKRELIREGKYVPTAVGNRKGRYTLEQKRACVELAKKLMASTETKKIQGRYGLIEIKKWSHKTAFAEAGRRLGVNGRSIEFMFLSGQFS